LACRALPRARGRSELTRVAVIADTHLPRGARRLPDECLLRLGQVDLILHAGDVVAAGVLDELAALATVEAVHGNMDEPALQADLPERRIVEVAGVRIGLVHNAGPRAGREERLVSLFPGCDAIIYGHTHLPHLERHGEIWIVNPGSPTERRRAPHRSMALLEVDGGRLQPQMVALP
jgi:uncharacterized protein